MIRRAFMIESNSMDALRKSDIEMAQRMSMADKVEATLDTMAFGYQLKITQLKIRFPKLNNAEILALFRKWLVSED